MVRATLVPDKLQLGSVIVEAPTYAAWREVARKLLESHVEPAGVTWLDLAGPRQLLLGMPSSTAGQRSFEGSPGRSGAAAIRPRAGRTGPFRVPRRFTQLAESASCHRDPRRWALLYRVLWRLTHGELELLDLATDDDVHALLRMEREVLRDVEAMKSGLRFRRIGRGAAGHYVAWYRPEHRILERVAPFLRRRFGLMTWSVFSPESSVHWNGEALHVGEGAAEPTAIRHPAEGASIEDWRLESGYRLVTGAPMAPSGETSLSSAGPDAPLPAVAAPGGCAQEEITVIQAAQRRRSPALATSAEEYLPEDIGDLDALRDAAAGCQGCELHKNATQTVFGQGPRNARIVLVGEQPGDHEDRRGSPFVGPAGKLLDEVLAEVGIDRRDVYVTNAVKHFKWTPRGKRRLHGKPGAREIAACRPWLEAELLAIRPQVLVCLGATAVAALLGPGHRLTDEHGQAFSSPWAPATIVTYHPSAILRALGTEQAQAMRDLFAGDLRQAATALRRHRAK